LAIPMGILTTSCATNADLLMAHLNRFEMPRGKPALW
jgi:hypothetical protein